MLPPVTQQEHGDGDASPYHEPLSEVGTAPIRERPSPLVDTKHHGNENQDGDGLKDETTHAAKDMPEQAKAKELAQSAAHVGRELGFYCREVAASGKPDRAKIYDIMGRMCVSTVETADDVLALLVALRTSLGAALTPDFYDESQTLWTEFYVMHTLADKAAKCLEPYADELSGDFDGSIPTEH